MILSSWAILLSIAGIAACREELVKSSPVPVVADRKLVLVTGQRLRDLVVGKNVQAKEIVPQEFRSRIEYLSDGTAYQFIDISQLRGTYLVKEDRVCQRFGKRTVCDFFFLDRLSHVWMATDNGMYPLRALSVSVSGRSKTMSLSSVLSSLRFYDGSNFNDFTGGGTTAASFSVSDQATIVNALTTLYNFSTTCHDMLEALSQTGSINFGFRSGFAGAYVSPGFSMTDGFTDPYILIDPLVELKVINDNGELFEFSLLVVLGHELSHWSNGVSDTNRDNDVSAYNTLMNDPSYDYRGDNLLYEGYIVDELTSQGIIQDDPYPMRVSYQALLYSTDSRLDFILPGVSYTDHHDVDVVRLGLDGSVADNIDGSQQDYSFLIFAGRGDDVVRTSVNVFNDYVYGGTGNDRLFSENGIDHLYGEAGDDNIAIAGYHFSYAYGGDGSDNFRLGYDSWGLIDLGSGSDTVYMDTGGVYQRQYSSFIIGAGADDALIWNGYQLSGGTLTLLDYESVDNGDDTTTETYVLSVMDSIGTIYSLAGNDLDVRLPDQSLVVIDGFVNGACGLYFDNLAALADPFSQSFTVGTTPQTSFCNDGTFQTESDINTLSAVSDAIYSPGVFSTPAELFV